jgi:glycosyl transferase family 87
MAGTTQPLQIKQKPDFAQLSIALVSGIALALTALFLCVAPLTGKIAGARDFVVYWATGQQLAHHGNPYEAQSMAQLEQGAGLDPRYGILYMRNPPWGLPIALPLGFVSVRLGALLWSLTLLGFLLLSVRLLGELHGQPHSLLNWLGYSFAPALMCVIVGQTSLFALLGLALFLRLHARRPHLAGMALWLCTLKPHLFLAFGLVLAVWIVLEKSYRVLVGFVLAMTASVALTWLIAPAAWAQYAQMMRTSGIENEFIPCVAVALRLWINPQWTLLQYLPAIAGCTWALAWYMRRRDRWDWKSDGSQLMLVSLVCAPYCWLFDQALSIPALLYGAYITRSRLLLAALALGSVAIEAALVMGVKLPSPLFVWTGPLWLCWYLLASAMGKRGASGTEGIGQSQHVAEVERSENASLRG